MGLLSKLKNTFFEEEYIEVEEKPKKEPNAIAKRIESMRGEREAKKELKAKKKELREEEPKEIVKEEIIIPQEEPIEVKVKNDRVKISYFEDEDFAVEEVKEEPKKLYGEDVVKVFDTVSYQPDGYVKPYSTLTRSGFKPTPIISPIYGVLDKNYTKDEVVLPKDKPSSYVSRKNADLDSVRRKAFGTLEDDIVMNVFDETEKKEEVDEQDTQLLYDMTENEDVVSVKKVTIADAEEYFEDLGLEYNVDYKDTQYEKATGRRVKKKVEEENDKAEKMVTVPDNQEEAMEVDLNEEVADEENDDNLFDLIDAMYEDKEQ